jgi:hypothetical protein
VNELHTVKQVLFGLLEVFMVDEYRWTPDQWRQQFLEHPLFRWCCQTLVWGVYRESRLPDDRRVPDDELATAFRIAEDWTYSDREDRLYTLPADADYCIGIVHPLHMTATEREQWVQLFTDYDLIPPFPQMLRGVFTLTADELAQPQDHIMRHAGQPMHATKYPHEMGINPLFGWYDHNYHDQFYRQFPNEYMVRIECVKDKISVCYFDWEDDTVPLAQVPPLMVSELLYFVERLTR